MRPRRDRRRAARARIAFGVLGTLSWTVVGVADGGWPFWVLAGASALGVLTSLWEGAKDKRRRSAPPPRGGVVRRGAIVGEFPGEANVTVLRGGVVVRGALAEPAMPGSCGAAPNGTTVLGRDGTIVSSTDPSAHPGAMAFCWRPPGHRGMHTWETVTR